MAGRKRIEFHLSGNIFFGGTLEDPATNCHIGMAVTPKRKEERKVQYLRRVMGVAVLATAFFAVSASAQSAAPNTITFENQSGQDALVKLVGPTRGVVPVPNRSQAGIHVQAGEYYILVRYGAPGHYSYSKGERFSVEEWGGSYSAITITLHKVINGNYETHPVNPAEFEQR